MYPPHRALIFRGRARFSERMPVIFPALNCAMLPPPCLAPQVQMAIAQWTQMRQPWRDMSSQIAQGVARLCAHALQVSSAPMAPSLNWARASAHAMPGAPGHETPQARRGAQRWDHQWQWMNDSTRAAMPQGAGVDEALPDLQSKLVCAALETSAGHVQRTWAARYGKLAHPAARLRQPWPLNIPAAGLDGFKPFAAWKTQAANAFARADTSSVANSAALTPVRSALPRRRRTDRRHTKQGSDGAGIARPKAD